MASNAMKVYISAILIVSLFVVAHGIANTAQSEPLLLIEENQTIFEVAQSPQTFNFTIDPWDYRIIECEYSALNLNTRFGYSISFSVVGGALDEFFICDSVEASLWEVGSPIYVDTDKVWYSTSGVTKTASFYSTVALSFVFNNDADLSLDISGTILIDSEGPVITSSLVSNATYSGRTTITASATDSFSGVESMYLYVDGYQHQEADSAFISFDWNTPAYDNGPHPISIVALDTNGIMTNVTYHVWVENAGIDFSGLGLIVGVGFIGVVVVYLIIRSRSSKSHYG